MELTIDGKTIHAPEDIDLEGCLDVKMYGEMKIHANPNTVFIDVDAGIGVYSVLAGNLFKQVYVFQSGAMFKSMNETFRLNNSSNVQGCNAKLSNLSGKLVIGDSEIPLMKLDEFSHSNVSMIKVSTDNLLDILRGGRKYIQRNNYPVIIWDPEGVPSGEGKPEVVEEKLIKVILNEMGYSFSSEEGEGNETPPYILTSSKHDPSLMPGNVVTGTTYVDRVKQTISENFDKVQTAYESGLTSTIDELNFDWIPGGSDEETISQKGLDEIQTVIWSELSNRYRSKADNVNAYLTAIHSLEYISKIKPIQDKAFKSLEISMWENVSIAAWWAGKKDKGYYACEMVIGSSFDTPFNMTNLALQNQSHYMKPLEVKKVIDIKCNMPPNFIKSSASIVPIMSVDGKLERFSICVRGVNYSINPNGSYVMRDPQNHVKTRNMLITMDKSLNIVPDSAREMIDNSEGKRFPYHIQGMEDVRIFGRDYFFCTHLETNERNRPQICLGKYDPKSGSVYKLLPLNVNVGGQINTEKNWMPFIVNEEIYFIYSFHPFKLYRLDPRSGSVLLVKEKMLNFSTFPDPFFTSVGSELVNFSSYRGSGSPIRYSLNGVDGWLMSIHQVHHPKNGETRKYFHRFMWFDTDFEVFKMSRVFYFEGKQIEFTLSLCNSTQGVMVPYSVKDNSSKIALVDHSVIEQMLMF